MKTFTEIELLKEIGRRVGTGKPLICPLCTEIMYDGDSEQELCSVGDYENVLFCPHCDLHLELKLVDKGGSKWRFNEN